jgi:peptide/nickel transport system permease protein
VGKYLMDAVMMQDYPAAQGAFYLIALAVVVCNLAADIVYGIVDPRIRVGEGGAK